MERIFLLQLRDHKGSTFLFKAKAETKEQLCSNDKTPTSLLRDLIVKDLHKYYNKQQAAKFKVLQITPLDDVAYVAVGDKYN
jgi:hypothetical protein